MSGSVNKAIIVGNLGKDAEIRTTKSGHKIAALSVATNEYWTDKETGIKKDQTEWHKIVIFDEFLANSAADLKKGDRVFIEGQIRTRNWTDSNGNEHPTTEILVSKYKGSMVMFSNQQKKTHVGGADYLSSQSGDYTEDDFPFI